MTKKLEEYFKPKIEEFERIKNQTEILENLEKLKNQTEILRKFSGEILVETLTDERLVGHSRKSFQREEFISRDYSLAEKIKIEEARGRYNYSGINYSDEDKFCIFDFYFELKDENSKLMMPIFCRHEHDVGPYDYLNVIYQTKHTVSGASLHGDWERYQRTHPVHVDKIIEFYQNHGVKKDLLLSLYNQINEIRKKNPEESEWSCW